MRYIFKLFLFMFLIIQLALGSSVTFYEVVAVLILAALNTYREKYMNSVYIILVEMVVIFFALGLNPYFIALYGITVYDMVYKRLYIGFVPVFIIGFSFLSGQNLVEYILLIGLSSLFAYASRELSEKEKSFKKSYDTERRYRYELESAKARLINSSMEAAHIAEIRERNRIAREIHDSIGHNIAGILLQLQAAYKVHSRDEKKSMELLDKSIEGLRSSLDLLRDTVHNLKPRERVGIEYIERLVKNFTFCETSFKYTGDFNSLPSNHVEIISTTIKEALTNTSKYSSATMVQIQIDVNDIFTRLYIKDNGKGSENIKEGLGISGMRERIKNIGGSLSIDSHKGFMIVCIIPREHRRGDKVEDFDSR